jgi:hypothetical protein
MAAERVGPWVDSWRAPLAWQALSDSVPSRADQPLIFAEVEHWHWVQQIELYVADKAGLPPLDALDCRFGKGLHGLLKDPHQGQRVLAARIPELHETTHRTAAEVVALKQADASDTETAIAPARLHAATDALVVQLRQLCQR